MATAYAANKGRSASVARSVGVHSIALSQIRFLVAAVRDRQKRVKPGSSRRTSDLCGSIRRSSANTSQVPISSDPGVDFQEART